MLKNLKNNKKGFTLIELLAVIVILAILITLAIPSITKYLTAARKGSFIDATTNLVDAVQGDCTANMSGLASGGLCNYDKNIINTNNITKHQLTNTPYGGVYSVSLQVNQSTGEVTGYVADTTNHKCINVKDLDKDNPIQDADSCDTPLS